MSLRLPAIALMVHSTDSLAKMSPTVFNSFSAYNAINIVRPKMVLEVVVDQIQALIPGAKISSP